MALMAFKVIKGHKGIKQKKERSLCNFSLLRGGYLLSHLRSTIGVVRFNFSVRDGKRWSPDAIATLISLDIMLALFKELLNGKIKYLAYPFTAQKFRAISFARL